MNYVKERPRKLRNKNTFLFFSLEQQDSAAKSPQDIQNDEMKGEKRTLIQLISLTA